MLRNSIDQPEEHVIASVPLEWQVDTEVRMERGLQGSFWQDVAPFYKPQFGYVGETPLGKPNASDFGIKP